MWKSIIYWQIASVTSKKKLWDTACYPSSWSSLDIGQRDTDGHGDQTFLRLLIMPPMVFYSGSFTIMASEGIHTIGSCPSFLAEPREWSSKAVHQTVCLLFAGPTRSLTWTLLFINDLPDKINSKTRLFINDCIMYRPIHDPGEFCLCWGFTAQSTQWGHVERGQFT